MLALHDFPGGFWRLLPAARRGRPFGQCVERRLLLLIGAALLVQLRLHLFELVEQRIGRLRLVVGPAGLRCVIQLGQFPVSFDRQHGLVWATAQIPQARAHEADQSQHRQNPEPTPEARVALGG